MLIISCGHTRPIYHGKKAFYRGKTLIRVWPLVPEVNLPWTISMDTSTKTKEFPMTDTEVKSRIFQEPQGKQPIAEQMLTSKELSEWHRRAKSSRTFICI